MTPRSSPRAPVRDAPPRRATVTEDRRARAASRRPVHSPLGESAMCPHRGRALVTRSSPRVAAALAPLCALRRAEVYGSKMRTTDVCPVPRKRCRHPASARLPAPYAPPHGDARQRVRTTFHDALPRFGDLRLASPRASSTPSSAAARATSDAPVAPRLAATNARSGSSRGRDRLPPARVNALTLPRPGTPSPCSPPPIARRGDG